MEISFQEKLMSLYRYWIYSNRIAMLFKPSRHELKKLMQDGEFLSLPEHLQTLSIVTSDSWIFRAYWYSSLYIVIEAYNELGISDTEIDMMMVEPFIDDLRLFRNGSFHFQKKFYNKKLLGVDNTSEFTNWSYDLHTKFGKFILKKLSETDNGDKMIELLEISVI